MTATTLPSILIVEDERLVARDLQQILSDMGYDPFAIADSADSAMASAALRCPDLVLMDIRIKGTRDGIQTAAAMRAKYNVAVVYLTAHADRSMVDRAKVTEPFGYLLKPVKVPELRTTIEVALHRKEAEDAREKLRMLSQRLHAITDNVPLFIAYFDGDECVQFANRAAEEQLGLTRGQAIGRSVRQFIGEERYARAKPLMDAARGAGQRQVHEYSHQEADGSWRYTQVTYVGNGEGADDDGLYVIEADMTELHNSYERIRELAQRLENIREDERKSIARMLHEGISQDLAVAQVRLTRLEHQTREEDYVTQLCAALRQALKKCMKDLRHSANELRPAVIAFVSAADAIREYAAGFSEAAALKIDVRESGAFPHLDEQTRLIFFRAAQEALTNVARHAKATTAEVLLEAREGLLRLQVTDDGVGIADGAQDKSGSFGLLGIRERFEARGGTMTIGRTSAGGTCLTAAMPQPPAATGSPALAPTPASG